MPDPVDLLLDTTEDLVVDSTGDISVGTPIQTLLQDIRFLLRTNRNDILTQPNYGADLLPLVGEPATTATAEEARRRVLLQLRLVPRLRRHDVEVVTFPFSRRNMVVMVHVLPRLDATIEPQLVGYQINVFNGDTEDITV